LLHRDLKRPAQLHAAAAAGFTLDCREQGLQALQHGCRTPGLFLLPTASLAQFAKQSLTPLGVNRGDRVPTSPGCTTSQRSIFST